MTQNQQKGSLGSRPLDTLAQKGTMFKDLTVLMQGFGSPMDDPKVMRGRAKRKLMTQCVVRSLVKAAGSKETQWVQSYWNSYHCQSVIYSSKGKMYGKYCKNRFCTLCCSIRKAVIINKYLPVIKTWPDPHHVVLTLRAVKREMLAKTIKAMMRAFKRIIIMYRKRALRGSPVRKLMGLRSLECNFNPAAKTYNPHFHLIVPDEKTANILINEWLQRLTPKHAKRWAQNKRRSPDNEKALIEIIKYGSKIFTEMDVRKKTGDAKVYAAALDCIFKAMKGHRIFDRFGFNLPAGELASQSKLSTDYDRWVYRLKYCDWVNPFTGERLTGYYPDTQLRDVLKNKIDLGSR